MKKVLLVEDDRKIQDGWRELLEEHELILISVFELLQAEEMFDSISDWDLVVMDGCVGGNDFNSVPFIRHIRKTFNGPMIAASINPDLREEMVRAGCSHQCEKKRVPNTILRILRMGHGK